jgi:hypothetical protein
MTRWVLIGILVVLLVVGLWAGDQNARLNKPAGEVAPVVAPTAKPGLSTASFVIVSAEPRWEYGRLYCVGELKNVGTIAAGAQIEVIARDANGKLVDSAKFWPASINNLPPGESTGFRYAITSDPAAVRLEWKIIEARVWTK